VPACYSGDIAVMEAESRLCYHAVPRILAAPAVRPIPEENLDDGSDNLSAEQRRFCMEYLASHRININVRQVN
jgi:hypothetical protein